MANDTLLRSIAGRGAGSAGRSHLERLDWLERALAIFVAEGIEAVRITRLADELAVTRGSFYWHFRNRDDLVEALVTYWRDRNTPAIEAAVAGAPSLEAGILGFFEACLDDARFDSRLDLAVREWARRSANIRALMEAADHARIEALRRFFARHRYPEPDALIRARVLYFAQIGFYALGEEEPIASRVGYTDEYFTAFTGRRPAGDAVEAFRARVLRAHGEP